MRTHGLHPARRRGLAVLVGLVLLLLTSCGLQDRASVENESSRLRNEVQRVVDDSARGVSDEGDRTAEAVQRQLESHVPGPPTGQVLQPSTQASPGLATTRFALNGKVDSYGPGGTTITLRICVEVTMSPPPDVTSTIKDTDCSALTPKADALVKFKP